MVLYSYLFRINLDADSWFTGPYINGILRHMADAELLLKTRTVHAGGLVEMVVWRVPQPVPPSGHPFKYRLMRNVPWILWIKYLSSPDPFYSLPLVV